METSRKNMIWFVVVLVALIGGFYLYGFTGDVTSKIPYVARNEVVEESNVTTDDRLMMNFQKDGYIVNNNPGMPIETPYFIYEEPGRPAMSAEIRFNIESECILSGESVACQSLSSPISKVLNGKRIRLSGYLEGDVLNVATLEEVIVASSTPEI